MITCRGVVGLSLPMGPLRQRVLSFRTEAASGGRRTGRAGDAEPGPARLHDQRVRSVVRRSQLAFAGAASLIRYGVFVFGQTVRHRDYFLLLRIGCLVAVVGLATSVSPTIEDGVQAIDAPQAVVGVAIALLVLLPETLAAVRAAVRNRVQTSLNLALGSALASIGPTTFAAFLFLAVVP